METIGTKISKIRKQKGMSQEELSDLSRINLRTLQRIEKDENEPRGNTLKSICDVLQLNVEDLMDYGKTEDNSYLMFLHLSIICNIVIPLGNIILPLILWLNKRDKILNVNLQGKNILNFQILFSIVINLIIFTAVFGILSHSFKGYYLLYIYFVSILINIGYAIYISVKINKGKIRLYYPNPIKFVN
jgi:uncharacterized Tic20 family protein